MIQLFHVYKSYGGDTHALVDVTLDIDKGGFVFLTGPSGAGKSTLLRLVFCAESPTRGQILVNGRNVGRLSASAIPELRRSVGVVFQDFKLLNRRSVEDNVAIALEVLDVPRREIKRRTYMMLKQVGLAHKLQQLPPRLSGGEQQRVAIARALVNDPLLLLADEPTGNLDPDRSQEIMRLLEEANARGTTVVVATHDRALIERSGRRVLALDAGRLVSA
ncbi:MAG: cell division ATP-binding protein FtsE [Deltaproteobacteria bacterium]|nr:cell division ATP-binding protein FtsE [Deltaproteobacteria bacterium]